MGWRSPELASLSKPRASSAARAVYTNPSIAVYITAFATTIA
jgi:hypothetical protein